VIALDGRRGRLWEPVTLCNPQKTSDVCWARIKVSSSELEDFDYRGRARCGNGVLQVHLERAYRVKIRVTSKRSQDYTHRGSRAAEAMPCRMAMVWDRASSSRVPVVRMARLLSCTYSYHGRLRKTLPEGLDIPPSCRLANGFCIHAIYPVFSCNFELDTPTSGLLQSIIRQYAAAR